MSFDIHIEAVETPIGLRCLSFGDYTQVVGVAGVQKMVDRFLKCFLTPMGSDLGDKTYGTQFAGMIGSNVTPALVEQYALAAVSDAEAKLREYDIDGSFTPDERLAKAELESIDAANPRLGVSLVIRLYSTSGEVVRALVRTLVNP